MRDSSVGLLESSDLMKFSFIELLMKHSHTLYITSSDGGDGSEIGAKPSSFVIPSMSCVLASEPSYA